MEASVSGSQSVNKNVDEDNLKEPVFSVYDETLDVEYTKTDGNRRSYVWEHFTMETGTQKAKCHYCKKLLVAGTRRNDTSALRNHLTKVCVKSPFYNEVNSKQSTLIFKPKGLGEGSGTLTSHKFSQEKCRNLLARMCIKDNRPFSVVDDEGLREFVWELNPMFKFPTRWTIARDCLKIYQEERKKLKVLLKDQMVSLTTDTWTSVQNFNYVCLTAHWIDDEWVLRKKVLNFCKIPNHKAVTIGRSVYRCLEKWGIDRVFTITVDNTSSNDGAIMFLKRMLKGPHSVLNCKFLHLRCNGHIINPVAKDGLEEERIFRGSKYVTANLFFVEISKLYRSITNMCSSDDEKKAKMGESMKEKFKKYWDNIDNVNVLLYVALVLDPRYKLYYIGYLLGLIYGKCSNKIKEVKDRVRATLKELFEDYKSKIDKSKEPNNISYSTTNLVDCDEVFDFEDGYLKYLEEEGGVGVDNNEVDTYLNDGVEIRKGDYNFDVLGWWKINSMKFPILSQIARDVLAMPISTVASESAFSTSGRVLDKYRSSLTCRTSEALICAQDWLRSTSSDLQDSGMHGE